MVEFRIRRWGSALSKRNILCFQQQMPFRSLLCPTNCQAIRANPAPFLPSRCSQTDWQGDQQQAPHITQFACVCVCMCVCVCVHTRVHTHIHASPVRLFAIPWTVAHQAPLSMEFSKPGYCSELPLPIPGDLPYPGIKPASLASSDIATKQQHSHNLGVFEKGHSV